MANVLGSATIRIMPDSSGFSAALQGQLRGAASSINRSLGTSGAGGAVSAFRRNLDGMISDMSRSANRMINMGEGMTYALSRPLIGLAKTSIQAASDFDLAMRTIAAVSGETVTTMENEFGRFSGTLGVIEDTARELGRTTKFSAIEVAQGFTDLARAGLSTEQQLGVIKTVTQLATVENMKLADASDRLINIYTGYGFALANINKPASELAENERNLAQITDVLARVSADTTTDMLGLTEAFRYAGPVAAAAGISFEEAAAALGVLAQAGFKNTVGGTALRGIITRLAVPTQVNQETFDALGLSVENAIGAMQPEQVEETTKALSRLGLTAKEIGDAMKVDAAPSLEATSQAMRDMGIQQEQLFDEAGKMRPLGEVVDIFSERYESGLFKIGDAMKLFGQRAGPAFLALLQNNQLLKDVSASATNADGSLSTMADTVQKSAAVQFAILKNTLVDLSIAIGQSGVLAFFVDMATSLSGFIRTMAETNPELFKFVFAIGGLVAAIGPLSIVLGLLKRYWIDAFLRPLAAFGPIVGGAMIGLGGLVGVFALIVSRSEELRGALGHLFEAIKVVAEPIGQVLGAFVQAALDGLSSLAKLIGDTLAPVFRDWADDINSWVERGGLLSFFNSFYERLVDIVGVFHDITNSADFENFTERVADGFESLGQAVEYVEENGQKFLDQIGDIVNGLLTLGKAAGGILITGLKAVAIIFEQIAKLARPLVEFLGEGGLAGVLVLLGARFLKFGADASAGAASAVSTIGLLTGPGVINKLSGVGDVIERVGNRMERFATGRGGSTAASGMYSFADSMAAVGSRTASAGKGISDFALRMEAWGEKIRQAGGKVTDTLKQSVQPALTGFFAGQLAASADSLASKITAVGLAVSSLAMAAATGNPFVIMLTAITVAVGAFLKEGEKIPNMTINAGAALDNLVGSLQELDGQLTASAALRDFIEEIDKIDPKGFMAISESLKQTGLSAEDMGKAFANGTEQGVVFMDEFKRRFVDQNLSGELKNFRIEAEKLTNTREFGAGTTEWEQVLGVDAIEAAQRGLDGYQGRFRVLTQNAEGAWEPVKQDLTDIGEITQAIGERFDTTFGGNAGRDFANTIDASKQKYELLKPVLDDIRDAQAKTAEGAKTWVDNASEANNKLSESKRLLDLISGEGLADPRERLEELVTTLRGSAEALKAAGATDFQLKDGLDEASITANAKIREVGDKFRGYITEVMASVPMGINEAETQKNITDAVNFAKIGFAKQMADTLGISMEEALRSLDASAIGIDTAMAIQKANVNEMIITQLTVKDPGKAAFAEGNKEVLPIVMGLDVIDMAGTFAAAGIKPSDFAAFLMSSGTQFKDVAMRAVNAKASDPAAQAALISFLSGPQFQSKEIQAQFSTVMGNLPEGWTQDMVGNFLTSGGTVTQLFTDFIVRPALLAIPGMTPEQAVAFMNLINTGAPMNMNAYLSIIPQLQIPAGMDPDVAAALTANGLGYGMDAGGINTNMQVTAALAAEGGPQQLEALKKLLSDNQLPTTYLPVAIQLMNDNGVDLFTQDKETLKTMLSYAMANRWHAGGIVQKLSPDQGKVQNILPHEVFAILEIGEAVIPKNVVDKLGADTFRQLISGSVPTGIINIKVAITPELLGVPLVIASFASMTSILTAMANMLYVQLNIGMASAAARFMATTAMMTAAFAMFRASMMIGSLLIVSSINQIAAALGRIPAIMAGVSRAIASGFRNPIAFIGASVWPPFANLLNTAGKAFGVNANIPTGFGVPVFHSGGLVGSDGGTFNGGKLSNDELFALLQTGEGVMSREMMASMSKAQMAEFRRGNPMWHAVGGPYDDGKKWVSDRSDDVGDSIKKHDLAAMKDAYSTQVASKLVRLLAENPGNISARLGASGINKIADGAFDWVKGANDAVAAEEQKKLSMIGLPPDFDINGAVPEGFDIGHWREFLGANRGRPMNWPLLPAYLSAAGVPYLLNSTYRPGDGRSYHASGRAVDFGAPNDSNYDSPGLLRINRALAPMLGVLSELIYSGPGGISDKAYDGPTMAAHHNHVHAALANGGLINNLLYGMLGEAGPEVVMPLGRPKRALDLAIASNLFGVLRDGASARSSLSGNPAPATAAGSGRSQAYVAPGQSLSDADAGFLGGGPGNTYNIYGVGLDQVKAEIKHRDRAVLRKRH